MSSITPRFFRQGLLALLACTASVNAQLPEPPSSSAEPSEISAIERSESTPEFRVPRFKTIDQIELKLQPQAEQLPADLSQPIFTAPTLPLARATAIREFHWQPTNFFHHPLYFDDQPLERYGQSVCPRWQPVLSGGKFFLTVPLLPYKMGIDRPLDCISTLGYYRPGNCNPCIREKLPPPEGDAVLFTVGTALGMAFLLP